MNSRYYASPLIAGELLAHAEKVLAAFSNFSKTDQGLFRMSEEYSAFIVKSMLRTIFGNVPIDTRIRRLSNMQSFLSYLQTLPWSVKQCLMERILPEKLVAAYVLSERFPLPTPLPYMILNGQQYWVLSYHLQPLIAFDKTKLFSRTNKGSIRYVRILKPTRTGEIPLHMFLGLPRFRKLLRGYYAIAEQMALDPLVTDRVRGARFFLHAFRHPEESVSQYTKEHIFKNRMVHAQATLLYMVGPQEILREWRHRVDDRYTDAIGARELAANYGDAGRRTFPLLEGFEPRPPRPERVDEDIHYMEEELEVEPQLEEGHQHNIVHGPLVDGDVEMEAMAAHHP